MEGPKRSILSAPMPWMDWSSGRVRGWVRTMLRRAVVPRTKNWGRPIFSDSDLRQSRRRCSRASWVGVRVSPGKGLEVEVGEAGPPPSTKDDRGWAGGVVEVRVWG